MSKKTRFHLNDTEMYPISINSGTQMIHVAAQLLNVTKKTPEDYTVIMCLKKFDSESSGFQDLIDSFVDDLPSDIYCYALKKTEQHCFLRYFSITERDNSTSLVKFRMLANSTLKVLNETYKLLRNNTEKTNFIYIYKGSEVPENSTLDNFPELHVNLVSIPKLVKMEIYRDGRLFNEVQLGPIFLKKPARDLYFKIIAKKLEIDVSPDSQLDIYYEYKGSRIPEGEIIAPKYDEVVRLIINTQKKPPEQTTGVPYFKDSKKDVQEIVLQYRRPSNQALKRSSMAASEVFSMDEEISMPASVSISHSNPATKEEASYQPYSPRHSQGAELNERHNESQEFEIISQGQHNRSSEEFLSFKIQLKRLLSLPDSDENDKKIKNHIATFVMRKFWG